MLVAETARLRLRHFTQDDAPFILVLLNEPSWIRFIGDRNIRTLDDARAYLTNGPAAMIARHGFGLYGVERKDDGALIGMCGLIKRDTLDDVDIGFALLPAAWGQGYAREAAEAALAHALRDFGLRRIVAITNPDNEASIALLRKLGFRFERLFRTAEDEALNLYAREEAANTSYDCASRKCCVARLCRLPAENKFLPPAGTLGGSEVLR